MSQPAANCEYRLPLIAAAIAMLAIIGLASTYRLIDLGNRTVHCDEAVQAIKFGQLLENGYYRYDPQEYHGPSLNYLTLPVAWARQRNDLAELKLVDLRILPALFGLAMVAMPWLLRRQFGLPAVLAMTLITAVSSSLNFYSRYYIHETLLVCFTFGAMIAILRLVYVDLSEAEGDRHAWQTPAWLVILGFCLGMMHATKETCAIPFAAMAIALAVTAPRPARAGRFAVGLLVVIVCAMLTSMLLYSSFLTYPRGIVDSLSAYGQYVTRGLGHGTTSSHVHAWHYYFRILFAWTEDGQVPWTETAIAVFAAIGIGFALISPSIPPQRRRAARFLATYAVLLAGIYAAIPYKTPWCALGIVHGLILLAGIGFGELIRATRSFMGKTVVTVILLVGVLHAGWQSWQACFKRCDDSGNPFVYAATDKDVDRLADRLTGISQSSDSDFRIYVICRDHDYWPLPWSLRRIDAVSWHDHLHNGIPAAVVIADPAFRSSLEKRLYLDPPPGQRRAYVQLPTEDGRDYWRLRADAPLIVLVRSDIRME